MNEQTYIDLYGQYAETLKNNAAPALNAARDMFFERFCRSGFPTRRTESYRHTDFGDVFAVDYGLNLNRLAFPVNPYEVFHCDVPGIQSYMYFVVNDMFYSDARTAAQQLPAGVVIGSLKQVSEERPELVESYLSRLAERKDDPFVAFNGAFAQDGFFMYVPAGVTLDRPVQLVNIMRSDADLMANSHNLIVLEEGASAKLLVCDHAMGGVRFCSTRTTEVFLGAHANYEHYKLESTSENMCNICSLLVQQQAGSNLLANIITLHNGITRNTVQIDLDGEDCDTMLCGMTVGGRHQLIDNTTAIMHNRPGCRSNELFKYILEENSMGVFNGLLKVAPDAQKTAAYQTNRNILLSPTARIRTKPQLEIYADDVKCSHGATTGQLDESALFYMRQRGISEQEARLLLMFAFVHDVIENIRVDVLKERIRLLVEKRLRGEGSKCDSCSFCK